MQYILYTLISLITARNETQEFLLFYKKNICFVHYRSNKIEYVRLLITPRYPLIYVIAVFFVVKMGYFYMLTNIFCPNWKKIVVITLEGIFKWVNVLENIKD